MESSERIIGVDESGKGDFFGPLVIAALAADRVDVRRLSRIGARDSKLISGGRLLQIDGELRAQFSHAVVIIHPKEYNQRYSEVKNLNRLLAWGHATAIERILAKQSADQVISDKFGKARLLEEQLLERGKKIRVSQIVRGEAVPQVAAASVLARAAFIREMNKLSERYGIVLPRGAASQVDEAGRRFVDLHGVSALAAVAKIHFKNYQRVVNPRLFT